jgi:hypothetical protein
MWPTTVFLEWFSTLEVKLSRPCEFFLETGHATEKIRFANVLIGK